MKDYTQILRNKKISPSIQRIKILEFLDQHRTHPTVDEIFTSLIPIIPTLSKMTIYNTLKIFSAKGLIKSIPNSENVGHYDFNVSPHSHFKCRLCKKVYDIDVDLGVTIGTDIDGYKVDEYNLILEGVCKECNERIKK
ncbi:transcriptional repressor [bacterium]|nr:transcriptional repressor [bacterium]